MTASRPPYQLELDLPMPARGEAPRRDAQEVEAIVVMAEPESPASTEHLMEAICDPDNVKAALDAVVRNKGAPGIDGITVKQLPDILKARWPEIQDQLLQGRYQPQPVRRVRIPKPAGGTRNLGIPTVIDRVIQQAILLRLQPLWDPTFSEHSYGFRPGHSAHQAVAQAQAYIIEGYRFVVDIDLAKFLDHVSYCPLVFEACAKRSVCRAMTLILNPFCFPRTVCRASSSQRLTRCNTVWRDTPRTRIASRIGKKSAPASPLKRALSSSVRRICQGAPGVTCSPAMTPSLMRRWMVEGATRSAFAAPLMVTRSPLAASTFGTKQGIFQCVRKLACGQTRQ